MKIYLVVLLVLPGCSEMDNRPIPEPPVPAIRVLEQREGSWGWLDRSDCIDYNIWIFASFYLVSDIPMPTTTYILVEDRLVLMAEGELRSEKVFSLRICLPRTINDLPTMFEVQIKPMHERSRHLPYREGYFRLPEGYRFYPYNVGEPSTISLRGTWCD